MPGHAKAALAAYPEFSCTGGPFTVTPGGYWPITDIFCPGNEGTFEFLEDILAEVVELFPGSFIHIGGDEANKTEWKRCPKCQARIKAEGLKDEDELQSYFVRRIEKVLNAKGRRLIGWDEILEGGLAPQATVMSWRGTEGGIAAAKAGHDVVMSPTSHCYIDYYQGNPAYEPPGIGGYLPLSQGLFLGARARRPDRDGGGPHPRRSGQSLDRVCAGREARRVHGPAAAGRPGRGGLVAEERPGLGRDSRPASKGSSPAMRRPA